MTTLSFQHRLLPPGTPHPGLPRREAAATDIEYECFYQKVGMRGLVSALDDCLGFKGVELPHHPRPPGAVSHFNPYEAKNLIEHAPKWEHIIPELQLVCLLSVWALAGRSLSITLGNLKIVPNTEAALELLVHLHERGWTTDSCRPPNTCIASYRGDFEQCARTLLLASYPELTDSDCLPDAEVRRERLQCDTDALEPLLGTTIGSLARRYLRATNHKGTGESGGSEDSRHHSQEG